MGFAQQRTLNFFGTENDQVKEKDLLALCLKFITKCEGHSGTFRGQGEGACREGKVEDAGEEG